jgi:hypothetical protein
MDRQCDTVCKNTFNYSTGVSGVEICGRNEGVMDRRIRLKDATNVRNTI